METINQCVKELIAYNIENDEVVLKDTNTKKIDIYKIHKI